MDSPAGLGHNSGNTAPIGDAINQNLALDNMDLKARFDELMGASSRCPAPKDPDTEKAVITFISQLSAFMKVADAKREGAKAPYLDGGRRVDAFFKAMTEPAEEAKKQANKLLTLYQRKVAEEARRKAEEEARKAREEEERRRREAEEAAAKLKTEEDLSSAISAERAAQEAEADRIAAEKAASVNAAELSRARSDYGGVASLRTFWDFDGLDRATLDLEALRPHIPADALEKALRSFIRAGGRDIKGARIYQNTASSVR